MTAMRDLQIGGRVGLSTRRRGAARTPTRVVWVQGPWTRAALLDRATVLVRSMGSSGLKQHRSLESKPMHSSQVGGERRPVHLRWTFFSFLGAISTPNPLPHAARVRC